MVGALILNRFEVRERLGGGGFGTVYRAWDERLERDVALKVLELGAQPLQRVLREAQAVGRLNHPSIVTLYELGDDGRCAYLVSELVEGGTLNLLQRDGALSDRDVGAAAADLCAALEHAHSRGVVHRDIKPQNVLIAAGDRRAKLMDFGIARVLGGPSITATGDVVGTLAYMAPEQAEGDDAGPAADVYSLALTLYEAWSGENPNARATPAATARAIGAPLTPLSEIRPDLPLGLCKAIDGCLMPEPERRPPIAELAAAVDEALPGLDAGHTVPRQRRPSLLGSMAAAIAAGGRAEHAAAGALTASTAAAMAVTPARGAAWAYLLPLAAGLLALLRPRAGYLLGACGLTAWLATAAARPGTALLVGLLTIPPGVLLSSSTGAVLPLGSPLLGLLGAAPVYPALAGLALRARDRVLLGGLGYAWLALAESALDRKLLFGPQQVAPPGWQQSAGETARHLLLPLAIDPAVLSGVALWSLASLALGFIARGRSAVFDLLGALIWAAALVAILRLRSAAAGPSAAVLAIAVLAIVAGAVLWRERRPFDPSPGGFRQSRGALPQAGQGATLS